MFCKKPVVIEAMQWDGSIESGTAIMCWSKGDVSFRAHLGERDSPTLFVQSPEGEHSASPGYWIIRGVQGEHYFCKPDIFELTYEPERLGLDGEAEGLTDEEIDAEAVATERARFSARVEMTDDAAVKLAQDDAAVKLAQDMNVLPTRAGCAYCPTEEAVVAYSRALLAEASARATAAERERCARWQPIETAPTDVVLLTDGGYVLCGCQIDGKWFTGWETEGVHIRIDLTPTHWMPLPDGPSAAAHRTGEGE